MRARRSAWMVLAAIILLVVVAPRPALALLCTNPELVSVTSVTPSPSLPSYDPFSGASSSVDVTITLTNSGLLPCEGSVSFTRMAGLPAVISFGPSSLQYSIQTTDGKSLLQTTGFIAGSSPPAASRVDFLVLGLASTSVVVRVSVAGGMLVSAGVYSDLQVAMTVIARGITLDNSSTALIAQPAFVVSMNVIEKCVLTVPTNASLDFSSAITNGHADPAVVKSTQFNNVQCTAPSILRLSGSAMQPLGAIAARTGFDNFINWHAAGTFGDATVSLSTDAAGQAQSASKNVASGLTSNGSIDVDVNLLDADPIVAGSYSGTLTVTIDPNL